MKEEKCVLVIEDMAGSRETYAQAISLAGYSVDTVENLQEAINAINRKTYHVAVVDITLDAEDEYNRDGLKIIEYLHNLGEGTQAIILSGQNTLEVAIEAFERFNLAKYLDKRKLKAIAELNSAVDDAYKKCNIKKYGTHRSLLSFLAGKDDEMVWTGKCLSILQPMEGWSGLNVFFSGFCEPLTPILPRKNAEKITYVDEKERCVWGEFWSKGLGQPISIFVYTESYGNGILKIGKTDRWEITHLIHKHEKANILGLAFTLPQVDRSDFVDRI